MALKLLLMLIATHLSIPAVAPAETFEPYLGPWELVAALDWLDENDEYPEGQRQRIVLRETKLEIYPPDGSVFVFDIEWSEGGFRVLDLTPGTEVWPAANPCQPNAVSTFSGSSLYPFPVALPCVDAPCLILGYTGCTDSPRYVFAPLERGVSTGATGFGTVKARF